MAKNKTKYLCICLFVFVCVYAHMLELYECKFHLEELKGIQSRITFIVHVFVLATNEQMYIVHWLIRLILLWFVYGLPSVSVLLTRY